MKTSFVGKKRYLAAFLALALILTSLPSSLLQAKETNPDEVVLDNGAVGETGSSIVKVAEGGANHIEKWTVEGSTLDPTSKVITETSSALVVSNGTITVTAQTENYYDLTEISVQKDETTPVEKETVPSTTKRNIYSASGFEVTTGAGIYKVSGVPTPIAKVFADPEVFANVGFEELKADNFDLNDDNAEPAEEDTTWYVVSGTGITFKLDVDEGYQLDEVDVVTYRDDVEDPEATPVEDITYNKDTEEYWFEVDSGLTYEIIPVVSPVTPETHTIKMVATGSSIEIEYDKDNNGKTKTDVVKSVLVDFAAGDFKEITVHQDALILGIQIDDEEPLFGEKVDFTVKEADKDKLEITKEGEVILGNVDAIPKEGVEVTASPKDWDGSGTKPVAVLTITAKEEDGGVDGAPALVGMTGKPQDFELSLAGVASYVEKGWRVFGDPVVTVTDDCKDIVTVSDVKIESGTALKVTGKLTASKVVANVPVTIVLPYTTPETPAANGTEPTMVRTFNFSANDYGVGFGGSVQYNTKKGVYWLAVDDENGKVEFSREVFGKDAKLTTLDESVAKINADGSIVPQKAGTTWFRVEGNGEYAYTDWLYVVDENPVYGDEYEVNTYGGSLEVGVWFNQNYYKATAITKVEDKDGIAASITKNSDSFVVNVKSGAPYGVHELTFEGTKESWVTGEEGIPFEGKITVTVRPNKLAPADYPDDISDLKYKATQVQSSLNAYDLDATTTVYFTGDYADVGVEIVKKEGNGKNATYSLFPAGAKEKYYEIRDIYRGDGYTAVEIGINKSLFKISEDGQYEETDMKNAQEALAAAIKNKKVTFAVYTGPDALTKEKLAKSAKVDLSLKVNKNVPKFSFDSTSGAIFSNDKVSTSFNLTEKKGQLLYGSDYWVEYRNGKQNNFTKANISKALFGNVNGKTTDKKQTPVSGSSISISGGQVRIQIEKDAAKLLLTEANGAKKDKISGAIWIQGKTWVPGTYATVNFSIAKSNATPTFKLGKTNVTLNAKMNESWNTTAIVKGMGPIDTNVLIVPAAAKTSANKAIKTYKDAAEWVAKNVESGAAIVASGTSVFVLNQDETGKKIVQAGVNDGKLTIQTEKDVKAGKYLIFLQAAGGSDCPFKKGTEPIETKFTLTMNDKKTAAAKASAKGKIDLVAYDAFVYVQPKLSNVNAVISGATIKINDSTKVINGQEPYIAYYDRSIDRIIIYKNPDYKGVYTTDKAMVETTITIGLYNNKDSLVINKFKVPVTKGKLTATASTVNFKDKVESGTALVVTGNAVSGASLVAVTGSAVSGATIVTSDKVRVSTIQAVYTYSVYNKDGKATKAIIEFAGSDLKVDSEDLKKKQPKDGSYKIEEIPSGIKDAKGNEISTGAFKVTNVSMKDNKKANVTFKVKLTYETVDTAKALKPVNGKLLVSNKK